MLPHLLHQVAHARQRPGEHPLPHLLNDLLPLLSREFDLRLGRELLPQKRAGFGRLGHEGTSFLPVDEQLLGAITLARPEVQFAEQRGNRRVANES